MNLLKKKSLGEFDFILGIPGSDKWERIELVGGGWSSDVKFHITHKNGSEYLLRVSSSTERKKKQCEFFTLQSLIDSGFIYSTPLFFGELLDEHKVYMMLKWVSGKNVEEAMIGLTVDEKYSLGRKAGKNLLTMHQLPTDMTEEQWRKKNLTAITKRDEIYRNSGVSVEHYDVIFDFVMSNLSMLEHREMRFHHGDYQGRNIIVNGTDVGVIDFNRISGGDPYEEFNRMMLFTRRFDVDFCRGQIDGYFNDSIPDDFFGVMAFHSAMKVLTSIAYFISTGEQELLNEMLVAQDQVFEDYNGFSTVIPKWYK